MSAALALDRLRDGHEQSRRAVIGPRTVMRRERGTSIVPAV